MSNIINGCFGEPCEVPDSALKDRGGFVRAMKHRKDRQEFQLARQIAIANNLAHYCFGGFAWEFEQEPDKYSSMDTPEV